MFIWSQDYCVLKLFLMSLFCLDVFETFCIHVDPSSSWSVHPFNQKSRPKLLPLNNTNVFVSQSPINWHLWLLSDHLFWPCLFFFSVLRLRLKWQGSISFLCQCSCLIKKTDLFSRHNTQFRPHLRPIKFSFFVPCSIFIRRLRSLNLVFHTNILSQS